MRDVILVSATAFLLAACATASSGSSMMITEDTALISVSAKGGESRQALMDRTLGEAATIARDHGFSFFVVLEAENTSEIVKRKIPGQTVPNQNIAARGYASTNLSNSYLPGATFTTPDQELQEVRPGIDVTIRMYRDGAIDPKGDGVFSSDSIPARANSR